MNNMDTLQGRRTKFALSLLLFFISSSIGSSAFARVITADVVALDQVMTYNRFGAYNPYGMIYALRKDVVDIEGNPINGGGTPCNVKLRDSKRPRPLVLRANISDVLHIKFTNLLCSSAPGVGSDKPMTRKASMLPNGVTVLGSGGHPPSPEAAGITGIAPGEAVTYEWLMEHEGTFMFNDNAAIAGGEGDGGNIVLGLFGAVNVEPAGSIWYRSQITHAELVAASSGMLESGHPRIDYEAIDEHGVPLLKILDSNNEIVHSDLNAIITGFSKPADNVAATPEGPFREFTVIFHDELKAVQAFAALNDPHMHGVRDGFGINYGSSGAGAPVLANRAADGILKDCVECAFEEFFLTSWVNGDPALLVSFDDDPSNVHHSYLNDNVKFRNLHAGPKETHIFHLHAHQWIAQANNQNSTYLDSQTIGPRQGFTYDIVYGGSGNRNKTPGDSIFHCHLYPHFAQGMWGLWRVHDVFEDGSRRLPDVQYGKGTNPLTGLLDASSPGTPIPALVPLPENAMAPLPTYAGDSDNNGVPDNIYNHGSSDDAPYDGAADGLYDGAAVGMPGYPFYIAGEVGHRPPQAPLDIENDGGLPRHVIVGGSRQVHDILGDYDLRSHLTTADIKVLPQEGTALEKAAMKFHARSDGYDALTQYGAAGKFAVNGHKSQPGAPYADPCVADDGDPPPVLRDYRVSAITFDAVVNKYGWHDPQARMNVLDSDVGAYERRKRSAEPFFFRANSGDCIIYHHTNRTPGATEVDDFQMATPTDTIGQHIHLVKFDVTASDGSGNGWNYEDGSFAKETIDERLKAVHRMGGNAISADGTALNLPSSVTGYQTTVQRWYADPLKNAGGHDRTIRTVYTHDHFSPSTIQHHGHYGALLIEPRASTWLKPDGSPLSNGVGMQAIIRPASGQESLYPEHREFVMAIADFGIVYDASDRPVNPPNRQVAPEAISADDPGTFLVNYRNEPPVMRLSPNGSLPLYDGDKGQIAYVFSSAIHGDPSTPIFRAYEGDHIQFRVIQGAQEEQHVLSIPGMLWRRDESNSNSPYVSAQEIGISEHFEAITERMATVKGVRNTADYLYHFGSIDDLWNGAWGLVRTFDKKGTIDPGTGAAINLAYLSNNPKGRSGGSLNAGCPLTAPAKTFNIEAWAVKDLFASVPGTAYASRMGLVYNARAGISDAAALILVRSEDKPKILAGKQTVEPLVIRANAGDCIVVKLTNKLSANVPDTVGNTPLPPITSLQSDDLKPSNLIGLEPQLLSRDARKTTAGWLGFNKANLAAPNKAVTYIWYAGLTSGNLISPKGVEFGAINLRPVGDFVKHGAHGLIGALIIEPKGATYSSVSGARATITSGNASFKEFVVVYQDGLNLYGQDGFPLDDTLIADDPEDAGEKAINYRTEPFWSRVGTGQNPAIDLNNEVLGDDIMLGAAETPVFTAAKGDDVRFRILQPDGRARQRSFSLTGHFYWDYGMPNFGSPANSLIAVGKGVTAALEGGAKEGTWIYRDGPNFMISGGAWGQFEVTP